MGESTKILGRAISPARLHAWSKPHLYREGGWKMIATRAAPHLNKPAVRHVAKLNGRGR